MFLGLTGTKITYDDKDKQWKMSIPHRPMIVANCSASIGSLALGVHQWTVSNDLNCQEGTIETKLTFSTCHLGGERKRVNNNSELITSYEEPEASIEGYSENNKMKKPAPLKKYWTKLVRHFQTANTDLAHYIKNYDGI